MSFEDEQLMQAAQAGQAERATVKGAEGSVQEGNENDEAAAKAREAAVKAEKVAAEKTQRNKEYAASLEKLKGQIESAKATIAKGGPEASIHAKILPLLESDMDKLTADFDKAVDQGMESKQ